MLMRQLLLGLVVLIGLSADTNTFVGVYQTTALPQVDTAGFVKHPLYRELHLRADFTFEEINENFQCFARPFDRVGTWAIKQDTLELQVMFLSPKNFDELGKIVLIDSTIERYHISGHTFRSLQDSTVVLTRK